MLAKLGEETGLKTIDCGCALLQGCLQTDTHCVPSGNCCGAVLKRALALISSDIVVRVARTTMEGANGQPDTGREFVQLLNTICNEVEPRITVLQDLGIINIYHLLLSPWLEFTTRRYVRKGGFPEAR